MIEILRCAQNDKMGIQHVIDGGQKDRAVAHRRIGQGNSYYDTLTDVNSDF